MLTYGRLQELIGFVQKWMPIKKKWMANVILRVLPTNDNCPNGPCGFWLFSLSSKSKIFVHWYQTFAGLSSLPMIPFCSDKWNLYWRSGNISFFSRPATASVKRKPFYCKVHFTIRGTTVDFVIFSVSFLAANADPSQGMLLTMRSPWLLFLSAHRSKRRWNLNWLK
jgi:hypothetical protein